MFFSEVEEAADEVEVAYNKRHADQGNASEPRHMNKVEENVFLS
jgi:ArsR family metal-binding transcriptional regulator